MQGFASKENILVWGPCFTNGAAWFSGKFWSVQAMGGINMWLAGRLFAPMYGKLLSEHSIQSKLFADNFPSFFECCQHSGLTGRKLISSYIP